MKKRFLVALVVLVCWTLLEKVADSLTGVTHLTGWRHIVNEMPAYLAGFVMGFFWPMGEPSARGNSLFTQKIMETLRRREQDSAEGKGITVANAGEINDRLNRQ
jgi:hypothetical protein